MTDTAEAMRVILRIKDGLAKPLANRRNELNKVADGEVWLTSDEYSEIQALSKEVKAFVTFLYDEFMGSANRRARDASRVITGDDALDALTRVPGRLQDAYERLCVATYGSVGTGALSNSQEQGSVGKSAGKAVEWRTTSDKNETGRSANSPKRFGSGKSIVKNDVAFAHKVKIDKKLRRVAIEIEDFLAKTPTTGRVVICTVCRRFGEDGWSFCPLCGGQMSQREVS